MSDAPKFDYGDTVRVTSGEYKSCIGAVVGISDATPVRTYTVEFPNGGDAEIEEGILLKMNE